MSVLVFYSLLNIASTCRRIVDGKHLIWIQLNWYKFYGHSTKHIMTKTNLNLESQRKAIFTYIYNFN